MRNCNAKLKSDRGLLAPSGATVSAQDREALPSRRGRGVKVATPPATAAGGDDGAWHHPVAAGWMVRVRFDPLHLLAETLQQGFAALFQGRVRVAIVR